MKQVFKKHLSTVKATASSDLPSTTHWMGRGFRSTEIR